MSKNSVVVASIVSLILSLLYNFVALEMKYKAILFLITLISWIAIIYVIFSDAKQRNKSLAFVALGLFLGGLGGLIYYALIFNSDDRNLQSSSKSGMSENSKKNAKIFSISLAVIFALAGILTLPFSSDSSFNLPLTGIFVVLILACLGIFFYLRKL